MSGRPAGAKLTDTQDAEHKRAFPDGEDRGRLERLRHKAETLGPRLAADRDRFLHYQRTQGRWNVLLRAAVIALAMGAAIQFVFLSGLMRDASAIRKSMDSNSAALARIERLIAQNEKASEQRETELGLAVASVRASVLLPEIDVFLNRAEARGEWQFNNAMEKAELSRKLKLQIRPTIVSEMEAHPDKPETEVRKQIEQLVAAELEADRKLPPRRF